MALAMHPMWMLIKESSGSIGTIPVTRRLVLYHDMPWFEMEVQCDFKNGGKTTAIMKSGWICA